METARHLIEMSAASIEFLAVAIIVVAIAHGVIRFLFQIGKGAGDAYGRFKGQLGRGFLLGLELMVAADIVRTVALDPSLLNVEILGLLVVIRTLLSWSLVVEIDGHWPWRASAEEPRGSEAGTGGAGPENK